MRHAVFALLLMLSTALAAPAVAQSCATLGGTLDCRGAAGKPSAKPPAKSTKSAGPAQPRREIVTHGSAETTISNRGVSTTLDNRVIDSHGSMEIGIGGSVGGPCRRRGYGCW